MTSPADLLSALIARPSVNPAHSDRTEWTGERRMAETLAELLTARGLEVEWRDPMHNPDRPAVIGRAGPAGGPSLLVEMHLDTVGVEGMSVPPFEARQSGGKISGRGSCDMKGSIAAFLHALTPGRLAALNARGVELIVVGAPDEEVALGGATRLAEEGLRADVALVLEPTRCQPVIAHKGAHWYDVELRGRAGHGSEPERGVSTLAALADLLPELFRLHQNLADAHPHPLLGRSSLNLGRLIGGQTYNIIPDFAELRLDRRVVSGEDPADFEAGLEALLAALVARGRLVSGRCIRRHRTPAFATDPASPLVCQLSRSIEAAGGGPAVPHGTSWVSDAAPLSQVCAQTVVFGPGDINQAHTADEFICLDQLELGARIFADFLDRYAPA